ncbi:uncharacterized protein K452DRAFT_303755 [Aplosporella prunicola CBS 121167]|uniref:Uncharacterized protein n=1 Tax=Aplosporella prunicola CBS 121167 TaxID=1176127 RepID=A0A6A6ATY0_9PEZI|nr:uncharacterized protein K452DRAFT_303755 [Aplosporella prunicola CBS 121167]KAF2135150.1 hypothetical protein K452DRAFT_303755 [Aplosporella prunicola CBS 121167]
MSSNCAADQTLTNIFSDRDKSGSVLAENEAEVARNETRQIQELLQGARSQSHRLQGQIDDGRNQLQQLRQELSTARSDNRRAQRNLQNVRFEKKLLQNSLSDARNETRLVQDKYDGLQDTITVVALDDGRISREKALAAEEC